MNIYLICKVRIADDSDRQKYEAYVAGLEAKGHKVHYPARDTRQDGTEYDICSQNVSAIRLADEVHVFWDSKSTGSHFDLGAAVALNKKIVVVEAQVTDNDKSFAKFLLHYEAKGPFAPPYKPGPWWTVTPPTGISQWNPNLLPRTYLSSDVGPK